MRLPALLVIALLAGCIQPPATAPVATPEERAQPPVATPGDARADAAALLPLALRWARAWADDAQLVGFTSASGADGAPELAREAQDLDGRDALWGFRFSSPGTRGVLVVQLRADGRLQDVYATGSPAPSEPAAEVGIGTREARWLAVARTLKVADAFEGYPATAAWAGARVDAVAYELTLRDGVAPTLAVRAWQGERYLAALVDAEAWQVVVGGETPPGAPQLGSTSSARSSSMPFQ